MSLMRRLRAPLLIALCWAVAWAPFGALLQYLRIGMIPSVLLREAVAWAALGAIAGGLFAVLLSVAERRRSVAELSIARVSLWGALGSMLPLGVGVVAEVIVSGIRIAELLSSVSAITVFYIIPLGVAGGVGACCAVATLAMGRRAPPLPPPERGGLTRA